MLPPPLQLALVAGVFPLPMRHLNNIVYRHDRTVQVAEQVHVHLYMCTLVNAWLVEENATSASYSGQQQDGCKSCVHLS